MKYNKVNMMTWRKHFLKNMSTMCLMIAMFFNPFGFDILFKITMSLTNSYWWADFIFYVISGLFFTLYFFLRRKTKK